MLTVNSKIQTRDGRKARIVAVLENENTEYPVIAVVRDRDGDEVYDIYTASGHAISGHDEDPSDLIPIPVTVAGFLNIYDSGNIWHVSLASARTAAGDRCKATVDLSGLNLRNVRDQ